MSGDVQPRKRKDKKKKRESLDVRKSEGELIFSRKSSLQDDEASHGVHITKMGSDDVHLHVQEEHGTGGHWCAKIIFFSLMTILMGLVCLIILENRGISDVDTPLSESRFSNYFDGWVDEHRDNHDDHHDSHGSLEHDDHDDEDDGHGDDDDHDEPFEEEADHSEGDEEVDEEEDENVTPEEEDEDDEEKNNTAENLTAEDDEDPEDDDDDANITPEEDADDNADDDDDENVTAENDDENVTEEATIEQNDDDDDNDNEDDNVTTETSKPTSQDAQDDDDEDDAFDEDDDGNFDSLEKIVDNDAAELELLKEKARQQAAAEADVNSAAADGDLDDEENNAPSWTSSQIKPKTGGGPQSLEDDDEFREEFRNAYDEILKEDYSLALHFFDRLIQKYPHDTISYWGKARALDLYANKQSGNKLLKKDTIEMYKTYLRFNVTDDELTAYKFAGKRCVERMREIYQYPQCIPIHTLLINRFPEDPEVRNDLVTTYLILHRLSNAKSITQEVLSKWPQDGLAQAHYGFILRNLDKDFHNAAIYLRRGIESNAEGTKEGIFYLHLGEILQRMGKQSEALEIYRKGADLKLFPSAYQRSLYNEPNLRVQPFWSLEETSYERIFQKIQYHWLEIKKEGLSILSKTGNYFDDEEDLKNTGAWKQFELFVRGRQLKDNCLKAPITCGLIQTFPAARDCRRGQVKFSVMDPGTHVWPHCGPTNCRLRAHLGLVVPNGTRIRVAEEERTWQEGKFLIFDDSIEHEVWHDGQSLRLVLIVDFWHPDLPEHKRHSLPHI